MFRKLARPRLAGVRNGVPGRLCVAGTSPRPLVWTRALATGDDAVSRALDATSALAAWPLIRQRYTGDPHIIPPSVMARFYDLCVADQHPLVPYCFSQLVTVNQVGERHFALNCDRLVRLLLARDSYEACVAFIRDIELANTGELMLSYDTLEALLIAAKWHNDTDLAMQAMQILVGAFSNVYARTWGLFLQLCLDTNSYEALKWIHKTALIPGLLVLDDASYLRLARIAAKNGDLRLCEWSSLRIRRRQRALGASTSLDESLTLYVYLIEAAAKSSMGSDLLLDAASDAEPASMHGSASIPGLPSMRDPESYGPGSVQEPSPPMESPSNSDKASPPDSGDAAAYEVTGADPSVSFQTVCRYLIRLGPLANKVSFSDLPQSVDAIMSDPNKFAVLADIYNELTRQADSPDNSVADSADDAVKTLVFNLLLHALLQRPDLEAARAFAFDGRDKLIAFNEDSILNFIDLAQKGGSDLKTLQALAIQCPTPKVMHRVKNIGKYICT